MWEPKVSIVLTTHDGRLEKLKRAIKSVQNQSYTDWELIIVDDGSKDGTKQWIEGNIVDIPRVQYTYLRRDECFGSDTKPKNEGILASHGSYIALLDSDNLYRKDHLAILVKELESNPKLDIAYGDRWIVDESGKQKPRIGTYSDYKTGLLFQQNYIDTSDVLIRREALFKVGGFDEEQKKYIDWNLWVRMEKAGMQFKRVPTIITDYYIHSDSKSVKVMTENEKRYMEKTGEFLNIPDWDAIDCEVELHYLEERNPGYIGEIKEPRVAIFSLTYDRLSYTKACFESMYKTAGYAFDHYVVDNGSTDGTKDWLAQNSGNIIIDSPVNLGISKASNLALDAILQADYDIIVKVDNDCLFLTQDWLKTMVSIWKANHRIALSPYVEGLRDNPGGAPRYNRGQVRGEILGMTTHLGGICHFVDASAYKDFRWDEHDFLHGVQDLEFSQYLNANGWAMGYLENVFIEHYKGTDGQHKDMPEYFERRKKEKRTRYVNK